MSSPKGLKRGTVGLEPFDPSWSSIYEKEKDALTKIFGTDLVDIQHVGSTSVEGLSAKPLIDILLAVKNLDLVSKYIPQLVNSGYEHMPERISDSRAFFPKGPRSLRTHHLSIVEHDSKEWRDTIAFRDYLRKNPETAKQYSELKIELAAKYPDDRYSYTAAKEPFIIEVLKRTGQ